VAQMLSSDFRVDLMLHLYPEAVLALPTINLISSREEIPLTVL
jgi:hypothetical protein